jgi:AraC-like DNA-binding protein
VASSRLHHRRLADERAAWQGLAEEGHGHRHRHEEALATEAEYGGPHDVVEARGDDSALHEASGIRGLGTGTDLSVSEVASAFGYASEPAFARTFKRASGKATGRFRRGA